MGVLIGLTYVVPGLESFQPWRRGEDYVPFWNVMGRPGEEAGAQQDQQLQTFQQLALDDEEVEQQALVAPRDRPRPPPGASLPATPGVGSEPERPGGPGAGAVSAQVLQVDELPDEPAAPNGDAPSEQPAAAGVETANPAPAAPVDSRAKPSDPAPSPGGGDEPRGSPNAHPVGSGIAAPDVYPPYGGHPDDQLTGPSLEGPVALRHYFEQLSLTDLGVAGAITRAGQWGDSVLGGDGVTHSLRRRLQLRFGDAGHGYHNLGKYGIGYLHQGIRFDEVSPWKTCEIIFKCRPDGHYGYGGASALSRGVSISRFATAREGVGTSVSRFELWYAQAPDGGGFEIRVDGELAAEIDGVAPALRDAVKVLRVPDGPHEFEVRAKAGAGVARGYGVVLERDAPGIVWDELSLVGSFTQRLDYQDPNHLGWQLQRRGIDLMVFMFGGNDVQRGDGDLKDSTDRYEREYRSVVGKFQAGSPQASCLIMSLIDHGERVGQLVKSREVVPRLVEAQRRVARAQGCAFFDTFTAMGGIDSIGRWFNARPQLAAADLSHPTRKGQGVIAGLLYQALMREYAAFRKQNAGQPMPTVDPQPTE